MTVKPQASDWLDSGLPTSQDPIKSLENLVIDNEELDELESILGQFNIFESVGAVRSELRHSDFLSFLLDPNGTHGWGDAFLKELLKALPARAAGSLPVSAVEADTWDLSESSVLREWQDIDILLEDKDHGLVIVIENKIWSDEHDNQLERYRQVVESHFSKARRLFLFLSPCDSPPSDPSYTAIDYGLIADLLSKLLHKKSSTTGTDVATTVRHYVDALKEKDGPMLEHGLQEFNDLPIRVPRQDALRPNQEFVRDRYDSFRAYKP